MKTLRQAVFGVFATLLLLLAGTPWAQPPSAPRVDGFDVEQVSALVPGTQLNFSVFGSTGATALLQIEGARYPVVLAEVQPGVYEGSYTIEAQDQIAADSRVTAELSMRDKVARSVLAEPLLLANAARVDPVPAAAPEPGYGAAPEPGDRAMPEPVYRSTPEPLYRAPREPGYAGYGAPREPVIAAAPLCRDCGVVEEIHRLQARGRTGLGAVIGGVVGGIFGNQVGHGDERTLARIVGVIGGALAGREIERTARPDRYEIVVRLEGGARRNISFDAPPPFRIGDRVRLTDGRVQRVG
jgi:hypothetical protein